MSSPSPAPPVQLNGEIAALIESLVETERRLEELTLGEVDTVLSRSGRLLLMRRAQDHLRYTEAATQAAILNALPAHIALLDTQGVIVSVNESWRRFAESHLLLDARYCVGVNYLDVCDKVHGAESYEAHAAANGIRDVLAGSTQSFTLEYPCHSPLEQRWFLLTVTPIAGEHLAGAVVMHLNITKRKSAEMAGIRLGAIVESSGDAIISKDLKSIITSWNKGAERVFGYSAAEMVGTSIQRLMPLKRESDDPHILEKVRRGEHVEHFDTQRQMKDGTVIDISLMASPIKDGAGAVVGVSIAARNITEIKKARQALKESEERFTGAFEQAPIGMALVSPAGQWLKVNRALCDLVGYSEADLLIRTFQDITHAEDLGPDLELVRQILSGEIQTYQLEKRYIHSKGHSVAVLLNISLVRDESGAPRYLIAQIQDITQRKKAEARLRRLVDSNVQNVFFFSTKGGIFYANDACLNVIGYTREDLIAGRVSWLTMTPPEYVYLDRQAMLELLSNGKTLNYEKEWIRKDGTRVPILLGAALFEDNKEEGVCFVIDLTERKKAEAELERTHNELLETSRLAGMAEVATGVLHNVGNVLNSVNVASICVAETIRKSKLGDLNRVSALMREHANDLGEFMTINPTGKHLVSYIEQLALHLNKEQAMILGELGELQKNIEHIKAIVKLQQNFAKVLGVAETLKITDLIEDALKMNAGGLSRHRIQITKNYEDVPAIVIEKHKMLQILVNLIRNAKDACSALPGIRQLVISVSRADGGVRIAVSDNGVGIPLENLTRIFAHGFTTKKEGHGFGLHSSVLAARELGGSLSVHSEGVGTGSTFTLHLPIENGQKSPEVLQ